MPIEVVRALAIVKKAVAIVNMEQGDLEGTPGNAIVAAADEVISGRLDDHFPLPVWQTGSGTQTNMNVNEVIARRAGLILQQDGGPGVSIHPNDHVNMAQSSNDAFPTAMHVSAALEIHERLIPALERLGRSLRARASEWQDVIKIGRTHLQDATPLTLGHEFSGYATQVEQGIGRVKNSLRGLYTIAQGGTAVGTGLNTREGFDVRVAGEIARMTGLPFVPAPDKCAAIAAHDAIVDCSGACNTVAVGLVKIANDIRLLASGPRCGLGEIAIPALEPGSSIMPGKVNPTQAEALIMVCQLVMGSHVTVSMAGSSGLLELNTAKPVMIHALLTSIRLLADASMSFAENCVEGLMPVGDRIEEHLDRSMMLVTALVPHIGYDTAARIARSALEERTTLREAAVASGAVTGEEFDRIVVPEKMVRPRPDH
jgi:fumarate hydratase class II